MTWGSVHQWDFRSHEWDFREALGSNVTASIVAVKGTSGGGGEASDGTGEEATT